MKIKRLLRCHECGGKITDPGDEHPRRLWCPRCGAHGLDEVAPVRVVDDQDRDDDDDDQDGDDRDGADRDVDGDEDDPEEEDEDDEEE